MKVTQCSFLEEKQVNTLKKTHLGTNCKYIQYSTEYNIQYNSMSFVTSIDVVFIGDNTYSNAAHDQSNFGTTLVHSITGCNLAPFAFILKLLLNYYKGIIQVEFHNHGMPFFFLFWSKTTENSFYELEYVRVKQSITQFQFTSLAPKKFPSLFHNFYIVNCQALPDLFGTKNVIDGKGSIICHFIYTLYVQQSRGWQTRVQGPNLAHHLFFHGV